MTRSDLISLLSEMNVKYKDCEGDIAVLLPANSVGEYNYNAGIVFRLSKDGNRLTIESTTLQSFDVYDNGELILFCNEWNLTRYYPCAFVGVDYSSGVAHVNSRYVINDLNTFVSKEFLKGCITTGFRENYRFLEELEKFK